MANPAHEHSLVFYRKYRPLKFADFINQEAVRRTLQNALLLKKISHGYLFSGVRGTGKTTMARLFAKTLNCLHPLVKKDSIEPCNECEICREMNSGRSMDLVEIDAASNRGIDEIRELKEGVRFSPLKVKYKVFIIDEVHMLTTYAFNALLKTLEEPPEHVIFILATTEPDKVPATILSRVQRFDFRKLSVPDIVSKLKMIQQNEDFEIDDSALKLIAYLADGSTRDAESILSQVVAFSYDKKITLEEVKEIVGSVSLEEIFQFLGLLAKKDCREAIVFLNNLQEKEYQVQPIVKLSIDILEKMLVLKMEPPFREKLAKEFSGEQVENIQKLAQAFSLDEIRSLLKGFLLALPQIKKTVIATLPVELAILEVFGDKT